MQQNKDTAELNVNVTDAPKNDVNINIRVKTVRVYTYTIRLANDEPTEQNKRNGAKIKL